MIIKRFFKTIYYCLFFFIIWLCCESRQTTDRALSTTEQIRPHHSVVYSTNCSPLCTLEKIDIRKQSTDNMKHLPKQTLDRWRAVTMTSTHICTDTTNTRQRQKICHSLVSSPLLPLFIPSHLHAYCPSPFVTVSHNSFLRLQLHKHPKCFLF